MRRTTCGIALLVLSTLVVGCPASEKPPEGPDPAVALQALIDSVVADNESIHGAALAVISPSRGFAWEGAAGLADPAAGTPMSPVNPVRIASNTKTYVAAACLRLAEEGRLDLDSAIGDLLPAEFSDVLRSDGYDPSIITVRNLLTHTGGLDDHGGAPEYTEAIIADPQHHWTPLEQINALVEWGEKLGEPGRFFSYSDSGYVLLGIILEQLTGQNLAAAVRGLVDLDGLGLGSTWWEIMEEPPEGVADRAHQYLGDVDVTDFLPTYDLYGGGGIAATVGDLARFHGGLFRGKVYHDDATVETMLSTVEGLTANPAAGSEWLPLGAYRMGVWVLETEGYVTYHHSGFWGTMAVHVPELDLTLAATFNQHDSKPAFEPVLVGVIRIVEGMEGLGA